MLDVTDFRIQVVRPTLGFIGAADPWLENLLVGTALAETGLIRLRTDRGGFGVYGMTGKMFDALQKHVAKTQLTDLRDMAAQTDGFLERDTSVWFREPVVQMVTNLAYASAIAALGYRAALEYRAPAARDLRGAAWFYRSVWAKQTGQPTEKLEERFIAGYEANGTRGAL